MVIAGESRAQAHVAGHDAHVASVRGNVLQYRAWGEFKAEHGWSVARDAGDGFAVQALFRRRLGITIGYVPRGPAVDWADANAVSLCLKALDALCKRAGAALVLVEPDAMFPAEFDPKAYGLAPAGFSIQPLRTIIVPCDRDDAALLATMKQKTRYNVRLAAKRGVTVRHGNVDDLAAFWAILQTTAARDAFGVHTEEYYADLLQCFPSPDHGALLCAEFAGEVVAAVLLIRGGRTAIYLAGASSDAHREHMPTYALQYAALQWAREAGCTQYDLWGIPPTDEPPAAANEGGQNVRDGLWGVYRFKQGFGGEVVSYPGVFVRSYLPVVAPLALAALKRQRGALG